MAYKSVKSYENSQIQNPWAAYSTSKNLPRSVAP